MADALTQTSSLSFDQAAWEKRAYFALRPQLFYDAVASVKATNQTDRGASVTFITVNDLAAATTALTETADVDAVALSDSTTTLTLVEYGNAVRTTYKVRATSFVDIDDVVLNAVGYNAGRTLDELALTQLQAGTNVIYSGNATSRTTIDAADTLDAQDIRIAVADLRAANVQPFGYGYAAFIHPDPSVDLRTETGAAAWVEPANYAGEKRWNGEIGRFEGVRFVESPRAPFWANASNGAGGAGTVDVYGTLVLGQEALAKAFSNAEGRGDMPRIIMGPQTDKLRRFVDVGWHWFGAYGRFREDAIRRIESASSIGTN